MRTLYEIYESITTEDVKHWVSDNYQIQTTSYKYKSLPLKYIKVEKGTGDIIIEGDLKLFPKSNILTKGFKIKKIEGSIQYHDGIKGDLKGAIEEITGNFSIGYCDSLTSLKNFPKKIGKNLSIYNCNGLTSLKGFPKSVEGSVEIENCPALTTLEGISKEINGDIEISNCLQIISLDGIPNDIAQKIKFFDAQKKPIELSNKISKHIHQDIYNDNTSHSVLNVSSDSKNDTPRFPKLEAAKLLLDYCGWNCDEDDIKLIGISGDVIEIELHNSDVPDQFSHQNSKRQLEFNKKTNLSGLVGKLRILNYIDNIEIEDNGGNIKDFEKVFINANPWRVRVLENKSIKDLSCLSAMSNTSIRRLVIIDCPNITKLGDCPKEISLHLYVEKCPKFKEFGCQLPEKIHWVKVIHCPKFISLEGCPKEMSGLECYATGISSFEGGIEKLESLDAHNCRNLISFNGLPECVNYVIVSNCSKLKSLEGIPKTIQNLSIKGTQLGPFKTKRDLVPYCNVLHTLSK